MYREFDTACWLHLAGSLPFWGCTCWETVSTSVATVNCGMTATVAVAAYYECSNGSPGIGHTLKLYVCFYFMDSTRSARYKHTHT